MRAVSLSDPQVISRLNRYFVPVYVSNEDYAPGGCATPDERDALDRIHREGYAQGLSVGTVHAYVVTPDGHALDSLHVAEAAKPERLLAMLDRAVQRLGVHAGPPLVEPAPPPSPPAPPGSLVLRLVARYTRRAGDDEAVIETSGGDWSAFAAEDRIVLEPSEARQLLPPGRPAVGSRWTIDRGVAAKILVHFFPPTENSDLATNRIDAQQLGATLVSERNGVSLARIAGRLRMKHSFYAKDDDRFIDAPIVGYLSYDRRTRLLRSLDLVTDGAQYSDAGGSRPVGPRTDGRTAAPRPFGVAVRLGS